MNTPDGKISALRLVLNWDNSDPAGDADQATMGGGVLWLGDKLVWGRRIDGQLHPVRWSWVDLLEHLSETWASLLVEQNYPDGLTPCDPLGLRREAERRWSGLSEDAMLDQEERIFWFEQRHDLARGFKGLAVPSVFLKSENGWMVISTPGKMVYELRETTVAGLEQIGDTIAGRLRRLDDAKALDVTEAWDRRHPAPSLRLIAMATGMGEARVEALGGTDWTKVWGVNDNTRFEHTETTAAARMSAGTVSDAAVKTILEAVAALPPSTCPRLEDLSAEAEARAPDLFGAMQPYRQGYDLAQWLRGKPGIVDRNGAVDPVAFLRWVGVPVHDIAIEETTFEALGIWGPRHGPAILLNRRGKRFALATGRRSILAHEICHLLIDRHAALPLAEVLGGKVNDRLEKRARAFGAEFLIPQAIILNRLEAGGRSDLEELLGSLGTEFGASREMIALQILNSPVRSLLNDAERSILYRYAPEAGDGF